MYSSLCSQQRESACCAFLQRDCSDTRCQFGTRIAILKYIVDRKIDRRPNRTCGEWAICTAACAFSGETGTRIQVSGVMSRKCSRLGSYASGFPSPFGSYAHAKCVHFGISYAVSFSIILGRAAAVGSRSRQWYLGLARQRHFGPPLTLRSKS